MASRPMAVTVLVLILLPFSAMTSGCRHPREGPPPAQAGAEGPTTGVGGSGGRRPPGSATATAVGLPNGFVDGLSTAAHPPRGGAAWPPSGTTAAVNTRDGSILIPLPPPSVPGGGASSALPPPYWIGAHPVTVRQYAAFAAATGHRRPEPSSPPPTDLDDAEVWGYVEDGRSQELLRRYPRPPREADVQLLVWRSESKPQEDQLAVPVVGVSLADALAYCAWAGLSLPTPQQWEYACRGPEHRAYPWGDEFDGARAALALTSVWDLLPGMSRDGVLALVGPVEEWCEPPAGSASAECPVRGLSWREYRSAYISVDRAPHGVEATLAWRDNSRQTARRRDDLGFRVALVADHGSDRAPD